MYCIVDMSNPKTGIKNIVAIVALVSYLLVGAVGFWTTLGQFFQYGTRPWVITKSSAPTPPASKVVWTQQKHYPSSARDDLQTPALVSQKTNFHWQGFFVVAVVQLFAATTDAYSRPFAPRAPPLA